MTTSPRWVSDAVVEMLAQAGVEHVAFNPGASFRGVHDSLAAAAEHGGPRIVLCAHEAISVAVAHGYAKASGRPGVALLHDVVGLQNASMAIYNAWCDRVPLLALGGTGPVSTAQRRPWIDWIHTANVQGEQVRNYVKWDDQPADAASIPRALARCLQMACGAPAGPVYLCLDAALQEQELSGDPWPQVSAFPAPTPPAAAEPELDALAQRLREAQLPVLVTDYAGDTEIGHDALAALAELLAAPVLDRGARHNLDVEHELNVGALPAILEEADLVLGIEVEDLYGALAAGGEESPAGRAAIHVAAGHTRVRSWAHDIGELPALDRLVTATADTALPALLARLRHRPPPSELVAARREALADRTRAARTELWRQATDADEQAGTVHPAHLAVEAWEALGADDPVLVHSRPTDWERRLWPLRGFRAHLGWHGGGGLGYGLGASIGAALALGSGERLLVDLQPDGDLLYTPSALWTAAHLRVPLLIVVQNNRQYGNTVGHGERIGRVRDRPAEARHAGAALTEPAVDHAMLARSFGVWSTGPVTEAAGVGPALREAAAVVRSGAPALVEVVTTGA